jgi:hypothetical protein
MSERAEFEANRPGVEAGHTPPTPQFGQRLPQEAAGPEGNGLQNYAVRPVDVRPVPGAMGEDVVRGTVFSLAAIPAGVVLWLVLWNLDIIASVVGFVAAACAARLYVLGSGGSISRRGAWAVGAVTLVTVLVSFVGGMWLDMAKFMGGASPFALLTDSEAWDLLGYNLTTNADLVEAYKVDFLMALLFSALGCFFTLRRLFAQTRR